jgi:hypothetical protein
MEECVWLARRRAERAAVAVFTRACREEGVAPHPGGECPPDTPGCPCRDPAVGARVEARAGVLAGQWLGIDLGGP